VAVFPDRIVLKNSTDDEATIIAEIETGGVSAITQGEIVLGLSDGAATLYTKDALGDIVTISGSGGDDNPLPTVTGWTIDSDSDPDTSFTLTSPTSAEGDLLVACIMNRQSGGVLTPPTGFTLYGSYLSSISFSGDLQTISVFTRRVTSSEPGTYTWTQAASGRICGWVAAVNGTDGISTITEAYGNAETASISTGAGALSLTAATWIYSASSGTEAYSQTANDLTEITDSPMTNARISGGHVSASREVVSTHASTGTGDDPNHGMISIEMLASGSPSSGGGGGSSAARLTEAQTAASGITTFVGIGHSGTLVEVTSSLDAWIVLYDSAASRTADNGRAYNTDPASGSGVLAEFYITAGTTVLATPGTTYFNNDTSVTEAIYAAVRDQAGADVNSEVTIVAYGNQTTTSAATRALLGIGEYVDDAAAGTGGVASGAMYYNTTSSDYRLKS
jgi:hypothetical protein